MTIFVFNNKQSDYDQFLVNIQMEASSVKDMSIEWKAEVRELDGG